MKRPLRLYGFLELVVVVVVLLTPVTFRLIGTAYQGLYPSLSEAPLALALVRFALAILALAPATLLMGATLPTLTRFLARGRSGWPARSSGCTRRTRSGRSSGRRSPGSC